MFVVVFVALSGIPASHASKPAPPAQWRAVTGGVRDYWLYTPAGHAPRAGRPMVVYLHGCAQNDDANASLAFGTRWNELAARAGAVVLYPLQRDFDSERPEALEGNGGGCWNWFLDQNLHRGRGEPALLAGLTREVAAAHGVDPSRIFVMGASAGANMANTLGITYPDVFRASAMFAGCAYARCRDVLGNQARKESSRIGRRPGPAIIFQGDADTLNNVAMGKTLLEQQLGMRRVPNQPSATNHSGDARAVRPGSGDVCVRNGNWPCAAGATGWATYPHTVKRYVKGQRTVVEWWVVHGLGHNYPSGDTRAAFTDPVGPDITSAAWRFFVSA